MSISVPSTVKNFLKPIQAVGAMISQFGEDSSEDDDLHCEKCNPTSAGAPKSARTARLDRVTRLRDSIHEHKSHGSDSNNALRHARLGRALHARFEKNGDPHDLDEAIAELSNAMRILPPRHRHKPMYESNVGLLLCVRYEHTHQEADLKRAISHCRTALEAADNNDAASPSDKAWYRANLATSLLHRYERSKDTSLLNESLALWKTAVSSLEQAHPDKPSYHSNISAVFLARYNHTAELSDLNRAVDAIREAVNGLTYEDPHWIIYQYMSSSLYYRRHNVIGRVQDLNMAIETGRSALQALPDNHRYAPRYQTELASKLVSRFDKQGSLDDINEAVLLSKSAAVAAPTPSAISNDKDKSYSDRYTILSKTLAKRFERTEEEEDLEESIKYARAAASAADKPGVKLLERHATHQNLADRAYQRFERNGDLSDLDESISHGIIASEILTFNTGLLGKDTTKAEFADHLTSLSSQHLTRFEYHRQAADLDNAVTYARAALDMASQRADRVPPGAAERYALGLALFRRFEQYGQDEDLEDSLVQSRLAFDLATQQVTGTLSPGAPVSRKILYQFLLSGVLCARYKRKGEKADLDGAIAHSEAVLKATPNDHPLYDMYYSIYAYAVGAASEENGVDQVISRVREEVEKAATARDPGLGELMLKLANLQYRRFEKGIEEGRRSSVSAGGGLTGDLDLEHAMNGWRKVATGPSSGTKGTPGFGSQETVQLPPLSVRMRAALKWADAACRHGKPKPAVEAYKAVLELAPRAAIARITPHVTKGKDDELALHTLSLASDAAAAAIQLNQLETAVEFLEQARNALWAQELGLPSEVEKLERVNPRLAKHVRELALEQEKGSGGNSSAPRSPVAKTQLHLLIPNKTPTKVKPDLEDRWEAALGTVRAAEQGFGGFMRPWKFETVKDGLPLDGIIVFLNCSRLRCDAIILTPAGHLHSVPLSNRTNQRTLEELTKIFTQGSRDVCESRITGSDFDRDVLNSISSHLWEAVVKSVTESLGKVAFGPRRIWWIPTGAFTWLPIHAASPPRPKSESDALGLEPETIIPFDWASSYAVTLRSLLRPLHGAAQKAMLRTSPTRHILAIGAQPARRTTSLLGGLGTSVQCLKNHVTGMDNVALVTLEGPSHATFANICRALKPSEHSVDVLHISLPIQLDPIRIPDSAWVGADGGRIRLADVLTITTSGRDTMPEFAFVTSSSLQMEGLDNISGDGEFLTMAGAMQFSGVGSVVGALWNAATEDSAAIAKRVYGRMFPGRAPPGAADGDEKRLDGFVDGVEALRKARVPLHRTLPFVHYGL